MTFNQVARGPHSVNDERDNTENHEPAKAHGEQGQQLMEEIAEGTSSKPVLEAS